MDNLPALTEQQENLQYITFQAGDELFGVNIHCVEEILLPPKITGIPRTPDYFLGITNLRGEVVSVIDLRVRFGLKPIEKTENSRIIVIMSQGIKLGMYVDRVSSIVSILSSDIKLPPPIIATEKQKYISGSFKVSDESILLLLDHKEIISDDDFIIPAINAGANAVTPTVEVEEVKEIIKEIHMTGFSIGREYYSIEGLSVEEIIEKPKVTVVPEMESFAEGIFHLRESVIPVIKLSKRLGLEELDDETNYPVIIVKVAGVKVGLIVEKITEVFLVKENEVVPPPSNLNKAQTDQLNGIIKLTRDDKTRVVMVLNLDNLFSLDEKALLKQLDEKVSHDQESEVEEDHEEEVPILEFMIGSERFAILVFESNEIIPVREIVPVPKSPPFIRGVINLRGDVISIIDLPCLINGELCETQKDTKILIVNPNNEVTGMLVDRLIGIRRVKLSTFEPPSEYVKQKGNIFIQGMGKDEETGEIVILMDLSKTQEESQKYEISEEETRLLIDEAAEVEESEIKDSDS